MSIEIIGVITLLAGLISLRLGPSFGFRVMVISMLLGSAAALIVPGLGTIQPAHLLLAFVLIVGLGNQALRSSVKQYIRFPNAGFWLVCTATYGLISAYFLPRFFAGQVEVNAVSSAQFANGLFRAPLLPSTGNITQSVYFVGDIVCFFASCAFVSTETGFSSLATTLVIYCIANIGFALLDIFTSQFGVSFVLDFIRNSTYVIYTDTAVGSMKRIIGLFTEASSFANATIAIFCFSTRLWLGRVYLGWALCSAIASFILIGLSTSSTGYLALPLCVGFLYAGAFLRLMRSTASRTDIVFMTIIPLLVIIAVSAVLMNSDLKEGASNFLDTFLINKGQSVSGVERAKITREALQTFFDTYGLGAGLGSVRASSFLVACLANLGLLGSLFFWAFLALTLGSPHPADDHFLRNVRGAARCACLGLLLTGTISGALIDLGLPFFVLAALACARPIKTEASTVSAYRDARPGMLKTAEACA